MQKGKSAEGLVYLIAHGLVAPLTALRLSHMYVILRRATQACGMAFAEGYLYSLYCVQSALCAGFF